MSHDSTFNEWLEGIARKKDVLITEKGIERLYRYSKSLQQSTALKPQVNDTYQYKRLVDTVHAILRNKELLSIETPKGLQDTFHESINKPNTGASMKSLVIDASMSKRNNVFIYRYSLAIDLRTCTDDEYVWYTSQVAGLNELCVSTQDNNTSIPIHGSKGRAHVARVTARRTLCESKRTGDADGHKVHVAHTTYIVTITLDTNSAESFAAMHYDALNSMESVLEIHRMSSTRRLYCVKGRVQYITIKRIPRDMLTTSEVHQDETVYWPSKLLDVGALKFEDCPPFSIRPTNAQIEAQKSAYEFEDKRYFDLTKSEYEPNPLISKQHLVTEMPKKRKLARTPPFWISTMESVDDPMRARIQIGNDDKTIALPIDPDRAENTPHHPMSKEQYLANLWLSLSNTHVARLEPNAAKLLTPNKYSKTEIESSGDESTI